MAEPARQQEPQQGPEPGYTPGPLPKTARSGYAIWSLVFGLFGNILFFGPLLTSIVIAGPSLTALAQTGTFLALSSLLAVLFGALGIAQINKGVRRGMGMAVVGLLLGIVGILGFLFDSTLVALLG